MKCLRSVPAIERQHQRHAARGRPRLAGVWQAFGNRYWPAAWLIDREGRIVYRHEGEGGEAEPAAAVEKLLQPLP